MLKTFIILMGTSVACAFKALWHVMVYIADKIDDRIPTTINHQVDDTIVTQLTWTIGVSVSIIFGVATYEVLDNALIGILFSVILIAFVLKVIYPRVLLEVSFRNRIVEMGKRPPIAVPMHYSTNKGWKDKFNVPGWYRVILILIEVFMILFTICIISLMH